ncbi:MAG: HD domain-containing protein [Candidatus Peribacteraceae bacterium]|nr:HD domain-containing protein [Candidatus Peribacteraceae bacterium]MDD5742874.1 HD domain-containing protein [Candidatus Peribacteraceae bacterium]
MQWQEFHAFLRHLPSEESERVRRAFDLCLSAHEGQVRKSGEPYVTHPIAVALIIAEMGAGADSLVAALLHDALEDTDLTLAHIQKRFGPTAAALIEGMTKLDDESVRQHPTLDEEIESLRKMVLLMQEDVRIMVIKLADRLHNMRTVEFLSKERQRSFAQETMDIYVKIAERMSMHDLSDELEALCIGVLDPDTFALLTQMRDLNERQGATVVDAMRETLYGEPEPLPPDVLVRVERKSWDHLRTRLHTETETGSSRSDVTFAFVCASIPQCYATVGVLHQKWQHEILSFKDFINAPAINGYRGLHTTIILGNGTRVRCKIRTQDMQAYARLGIATLCFDKKAVGIMEYLPWTERIAPLSKDTADKSQEFWDSLQSDILGKSIFIYGPDDSTIQLPTGATVLDGAFYLYKEKALKTKTIRINGKEAPFFSPLADNASLSLELASEPTVSREWLEWVHTGVAIASIRSLLGSASRQQNIENGRRILQEAMIKQARGYLKEFKEESLLKGIRTLGYSSLDEAFIAVADGHLQPSVAIAAIFRSSRPHGNLSPDKTLCTVQCTLPTMSFHDLLTRFLVLAEKYGVTLGDVQILPTTNQHVKVSLRLPLSSEEQQIIVTELRAVGAGNVRVFPTYSVARQVLTVILIFALWGFDPIVAHLLLRTHSIFPLDLTIIRFFSLLVMSGLLLIWARLHSPLRYASLPLRSRTLWLSVIALFFVAIFTYASLEQTLPSHYTIPMTASGFLLTTLVNRKRWKTLLAAWLCFAVGLFLLVSFTPSWTVSSIVFTGIAIVAFTVFSIASERYKRLEHVDVRAAQYFFILSFFCALFVLPLLPMAHLTQYTAATIARMILFSFFFAGLPYYIYYYLLSHREIDFVLRYSFLLIFTTLVGQALLMGNVTQPVFVAGSVVALGAALPLIVKLPSPPRIARDKRDGGS